MSEDAKNTISDNINGTVEDSTVATTTRCNDGDAANLNAAPSPSEPANNPLHGDGTHADKLHIADEVITQIILIAVGKTAGISLPSAGVGDGIAGFLGMKGSPRGIRIETDEKSVAVDITISVDYGLKISELAKTLQDRIRDDLSDMTGLEVTNVNVHVASVNTKDVPVIKSPKAGKAQQKDAIEEDASAPAPVAAPAPTPAAAPAPAPAPVPAPAPAPTAATASAPAAAPAATTPATIAAAATAAATATGDAQTSPLDTTAQSSE